MSLDNLLSLDESQAKTVRSAVRAWCDKYKVPSGSERERAAMSAAINCALSGETSQAALLETIGIEMRIMQYKMPSD